MIKIHLSRLLGELKMSQAELARRTQIRPSTINELYWELCERINLDHLDKICETLNCRIDELIEFIPDNEVI